MTVKTVDVGKLVVTQSNDLARTKYSMSLQEQRLILILIAMIRQDHDVFYRYQIPVADLPQIFGVPQNHIYNISKEVCEKLMGRVVTKKVKGGWDMFQWIFRAKYREHMEEFDGAGIELQIHEDMRPYLLELKERFASLPLYHLAHLPSFHSIHLFMILWHESYSMTRPEFYIELHDLKMRLDVAGKYKNFAYLRREILEKAQKDFANLTPMCFDWKTETRGRKVIGLHFTVFQNPQPYQLSFELPQWLRYSELPALSAQGEVMKESTLLLERLVNEFGFKEKAAQDFLSTYPADYIIANLDVVEKAVKRGKVKNKTAYAVKALRTDYRNKKEKMPEQRVSQKQAEDDEEKQLRKLYESEKQTAIENAHTDIGLETIFSDFREHITGLASQNETYRKHVVMPDETFDSYTQEKGNLALFNVFLLDNYIAPQYASFEAWQKQRNGA